jgi:hypothetical protein
MLHMLKIYPGGSMTAYAELAEGEKRAVMGGAVEVRPVVEH